MKGLRLGRAVELHVVCEMLVAIMIINAAAADDDDDDGDDDFNDN